VIDDIREMLGKQLARLLRVDSQLGSDGGNRRLAKHLLNRIGFDRQIIIIADPRGNLLTETGLLEPHDQATDAINTILLQALHRNRCERPTSRRGFICWTLSP